MNKTYVIRRNDRDSIPMGAGVRVTVLRKSADECSMLLQMEPGSRFPVHEHVGGEEVFVVDGEVTFGDLQLGTGDYLYMPPGISRAAVTSEGCTLLIFSGKTSAAPEPRFEGREKSVF